MKRFILIDGNAIVHRAYHALPALTTPKGIPSGAVYGFTSILIKILKEFSPTYIAAAYDLAKPTFRHKKFEEYKAKRVVYPRELYDQIEQSKEILQAFGIPIYAKEGYEADDLIATAVAKIKIKNEKLKDKIESIIVTGDFDTLQLVDQNTLVYYMRKGITDTLIYDQNKFKERYRFLPRYFVDFKALRGDPSDNIPGVPGIGEKTATELISKYGSIENIFSHINHLPEKTKKILTENKEKAFFSKDLVILNKRALKTINLADCRVSLNYKAIKEVFQKFGFKTLLERLPEDKSNPRLL